MSVQRKIAVVGAGFAGAVVARQLADAGVGTFDVFDTRGHIAGNCHTARDEQTGVMVHEYGPHIFHTDREDVWQYVNRWVEYKPFINRIKAVTKRGVYSLPLNLLTFNQFFGRTMSPREAEAFVATVGDASIIEPQNFEEQALRMIGRDLYENFFYGYTKKQWGVEPRELPASILKRLPLRFTYDDNYYTSAHQGIPAEGYTAVVERLLDHPGIRVHLGVRFDRTMTDSYDHVFYSGPLDGWFGHSAGRLRYRSVTWERFHDEGDYQGNALVNYCDEGVPYTRIIEHKHFTPWERHERTTCSREYSRETTDGESPAYPMRLAEDKKILAEYMRMAETEDGVTFIGRLGTYRYLDMDTVIGESLDLAVACLARSDTAKWPTFSRSPL